MTRCLVLRRSSLILPVLLALLASVPSGAAYVDTGTTGPPKPPAVIYQGGGRTGGDTVADAVWIGSLPFSDGGTTCGYADNYDETCPYSGSTSPDVVYAFLPVSTTMLSIDLCSSLYDTKVYVYAGSPGNLVACNDDAGCGYSGWQSKLVNVSLNAGATYYIVVDGYGGACGTYAIQVSEFPIGCSAWYCPPGSLEEGEPDCQDGYVDLYNGGCSTTGWTPIPPQDAGCSTMCGRSGNYSYQGLSYRDTDWYTVTAAGGPVEMEVCATFPLQIILIWNPDCDDLQYDIAWAGELEEANLSHDMPPGAETWLWVGASVFNGVPCGSDYVMDVCGIEEPPVPVARRSWGAVKNLYRERE